MTERRLDRAIAATGDRAVPLIVLLHVPKTAGTTLAALLRYHYRGGAFRGAANVLTRPAEAERRIEAIARKGRILAVAGHVTFGILQRLPPDTRFLTLLRDPVERTLSHFDFLVHPPARRTKPAGIGLVPAGLPPPSPGLTLDECLREDGYIPDNLQTRMLCGLVSPADPLPADALDRAKRNLRERFAFVGTTERFDEYVALLDLELGWPATAYTPARPNPDRPRPDEATRRLAAERNGLDLQLHTFAGELLDEQVERRRIEVEAEAAVIREAVRRWNGAAATPTPGLEERIEAALAEARAAEAELERRRAMRTEKLRRRAS